MKKLLIVILGIIFISGILAVNSSSKESTSINDKLIRFHVIANSDLDEDQAVKLKVRDAVLKYVDPKLSKSSSREESIKILEENLSSIEAIANGVLKEEGETYKAEAMLGDFNFPIKKYGPITLPAGEYKAVRVVLGNGDGKNWWCVMFPPLCFIDITKGVTSKETEEKLNKQLKTVLNDDEIEAITAFKQSPLKKEFTAKVIDNKALNNQQKSKKSSQKSEVLEPNVEFRYKSVEIFERTYEKVKNMLR